MSAGIGPCHPDLERIRRTLRYRLAASGRTQVQLAAHSGLSNPHLSQLLASVNRIHRAERPRDLSLQHLLAILHGLGVSPGDFFAELTWELGYPRPARLAAEQAAALAQELASDVVGAL